MRTKTAVVRRTELEKAFAREAGISAENGKRLLATFFRLLSGCLLDRKTVCMGRVGRLNVYQKAARIGRNPRHPDDEVIIPAHWEVRFVLRGPLRAELRRIPVDVDRPSPARPDTEP